MRLLLINPSNPYVTLSRVRESFWNRYRVWKPLGLLVIAGLTPPDWEITIVDENLSEPDYSALPRPDLVGITAFTSQAPRAYQVAADFRRLRVPVVLGGIHATMRLEEALGRVDSVVTGEAETVWTRVLDDVRNGGVKRVYSGEPADMADFPPARHDLLSTGYAFGSIQTTRGCPLDCRFCSVSAFNGSRYRQRPIEQLVQEFRLIREKFVLIVDDNLIGTRREHIVRSKALFRAMIAADVRKKWMAQVTINMADDEELLRLASQAGCVGVFVGFESPSTEGLAEIGKKFNYLNSRDFRDSVRRIRRHRILVAASFIMGLDTDKPGIGRRIAQAGNDWGVDHLNVLFLTPLPGTRLWQEMESENRLVCNSFPDEWKYYTLTVPVARYRHLSWEDILAEMDACNEAFYSIPRILWRACGNLWHRRHPVFALVGNLSYRANMRLDGMAGPPISLNRGPALGSDP